MSQNSISCLFTILSLVLGYSTRTDAFTCYACTYVFSGNQGIAGYECVNDTAKYVHTRTLQCDLPKKCTIKTVYEEGYSRLISLSRSCQVPDNENGCYTPSIVRPTCFKNCQTDHCNDADGDMKPPTTPPSGSGQDSSNAFTAISIFTALLAVGFAYLH